MDFDAFSKAHREEWDRLNQLTRMRRLTGAQADELIRLYHSTATHLSMLRSSAPDPALISELSLLLVRARAKIVGSPDPQWSVVGKFFTVSLPAALYRCRWWTHGVTAVCLIFAVAMGVWVATTPEGIASMGSEAERLEYVNNAFAEYYEPGAGFASMVWTNNAWIAAQCVAFGITGIWPAFVLTNNAISVGAIGGMMEYHDALGTFFALILPHGFLELTSIFVAGGAGLKLFWTVVSPGRRPRSVAIAQEGRALMTVALGLVFALALSGVIEGFVTGSHMYWWLKIVIGALALAAFWTYVYVLGRRAVAAGETGDLSADRAGYGQIYA